MFEDWRRTDGGLEEDWRRTGGGSEKDWRRIGRGRVDRFSMDVR